MRFAHVFIFHIHCETTACDSNVNTLFFLLDYIIK